MNKVIIKKTPNGDIRSLKVLDKNLVYQDTVHHIQGVQDVMKAVAEALIEQSKNHDYTKLGKYYDDFFAALSSGLKGEEFYKLPWWKIHETKERHHLNKHYPDDVNLIDVIEMLCDCVAAGKARTGNVYPIHLPNAVLQLAVENTVKMLIENVEAE